MGRRSEAGFASLWAVWATAVVLVAGCVAMMLAVATARQHRLDGAADLAAISAATSLARGQPACSAAGEVAKGNQVTLTSCTVVGVDVLVAVSDELRLPFGIGGRLVSSARAGPDPAEGDNVAVGAGSVELGQ